jgi:hypothetical protein
MMKKWCGIFIFMELAVETEMEQGLSSSHLEEKHSNTHSS